MYIILSGFHPLKKRQFYIKQKWNQRTCPLLAIQVNQLRNYPKNVKQVRLTRVPYKICLITNELCL